MRAHLGRTGLHAERAAGNAAPAPPPAVALAPPPPVSDAAIGATLVDDPPMPPPGVLIREVDQMGRASDRALGAMQQLTTARIVEEVTTPEAAVQRFREISGRGIDNLQPDELRQLHALLEELPEGIRVPRPEPGTSALAAAAATQQRFPTGNSWFLGEGPRQVVSARTLQALPDEAAASARLRELVEVRDPTRDNIEEIRVILDGLPSERIPRAVAAWPERDQAVRQLGWVSRVHGGPQEGFSVHQEAGALLFRLRNLVGTKDEQALLGSLDVLLDKPLAKWDAADVRELKGLMEHPQMPRPDVQFGWDLPETLKQTLRAASSEYAPFAARENSTLNLIITDLRVARQQRLGVMGNRTHDLAGRIVEGTNTPAELQELRMIAEREPALASLLPDWVRSADRSYRPLDTMLVSPRNREQLREALVPMVDFEAPANELRALVAKPTLADDEAIRAVRLAGRLEAFGREVPAEALPKLPRAIEQSLLVSGTDPVVVQMSQRLATRFGWPLDDNLRTISEARRIAALLQSPSEVNPHRVNTSETVRASLEVVDDMLAPDSGVDPALKRLLTSTREVLARHQSRIAPGAAPEANQSGVQGWQRHPDYAEMGAAASNIELGAEMLSATRRSAASAVVRPVANGAETLRW